MDGGMEEGGMKERTKLNAHVIGFVHMIFMKSVSPRSTLGILNINWKCSEYVVQNHPSHLHE